MKDDKVSQKSNSELRISEDDLFTYFLQHNFWTKMYFEEFEKLMEDKGVTVYDKRLG